MSWRTSLRIGLLGSSLTRTASSTGIKFEAVLLEVAREAIQFFDRHQSDALGGIHPESKHAAVLCVDGVRALLKA